MAYLVGFEPRFEEALLILAGKAAGRRHGTREPGLCPGFAARSRARPLSALRSPRAGPQQDPAARRRPSRARHRPRHRRLALPAGNISGRHETSTPDAWLETPSFIVDTLRAIAGDGRPRRQRDADPHGFQRRPPRDQRDRSAGPIRVRRLPRLRGGQARLLGVQAGHARVRCGAADAADRPAAELPPDARLGTAREPRPAEPQRPEDRAWRALSGCLRHLGRADLPGGLAGRRRKRAARSDAADYVERLAKPYFACAPIGTRRSASASPAARSTRS